MTLIADLSPPDRRAEAASYFSVAVYVGLGIGPIIGEAMLELVGLPQRVRPRRAVRARRSRRVHRRPGRRARRRRGRASTATPAPRSRTAAWLHPAAVGPGTVLAFGMAAFAVFVAFLPDYSRSLGLSGSGGLFAVYSATCLVLRVAGARLPERLGPRLAVTIAFTMLGLGLALLAGVTEPWALWVAAACVGVGMAFMYPSLLALTVNRTHAGDRPRAISSFTMFFEAGTAVGGLALGALAHVFDKRAGVRRRRRPVRRRVLVAAQRRHPDGDRRAPAGAGRRPARRGQH